jgi:hypothetical protein
LASVFLLFEQDFFQESVIFLLAACFLG